MNKVSLGGQSLKNDLFNLLFGFGLRLTEMKKFKLWYLRKVILLCNSALKFSSGANDQNEVNGVVKIKNYFIREYYRVNK